MPIDRHLAKSLVAGSDHRYKYRIVFCDRQWPPRKVSHSSLVWPAMAIDGHGLPPIVFDNAYRSTEYHQSLVADNIYRYVSSLVYRRSNARPLLCLLFRMYVVTSNCCRGEALVSTAFPAASV